MLIKDLLLKFAKYCVLEERLSSTTVRGIKIAINAFLKRTNVEIIHDVSLDVLRRFFYEGIEVYQWSYSSINNYHKYLKKFLNWCVTNGYIDSNPILKYKKPPKPKSLPRRLSLKNAQTILYASLTYNWTYEFEYSRNHAIIATFIYSGIRCNELINLQINDVNLDDSTILIRNGKGSKDRYVPIHYKLKYILKKYCTDRNKLNKNSIYFFHSIQSSNKLGYKNVNTICKKLAKYTNIYFRAHCLRHTFASLAIEENMGIMQLKEILGHTDISSTMIYLKLSTRNLQESLDQCNLV